MHGRGACCILPHAREQVAAAAAAAAAANAFAAAAAATALATAFAAFAAAAAAATASRPTALVVVVARWGQGNDGVVRVLLGAGERRGGEGAGGARGRPGHRRRGIIGG